MLEYSEKTNRTFMYIFCLLLGLLLFLCECVRFVYLRIYGWRCICVFSSRILLYDLKSTLFKLNWSGNIIRYCVDSITKRKRQTNIQVYRQTKGWMDNWMDILVAEWMC